MRRTRSRTKLLSMSLAKVALYKRRRKRETRRRIKTRIMMEVMTTRMTTKKAKHQ